MCQIVFRFLPNNATTAFPHFVQASCVALKQCADICDVVVSRFLHNHYVELVFTHLELALYSVFKE